MDFLSQKKHRRIIEVVFLKKDCINQSILPWLQHVHFISNFCALGTHEHLIVHFGFKSVNSVAQTLLPGSPAVRRPVLDIIFTSFPSSKPSFLLYSHPFLSEGRPTLCQMALDTDDTFSFSNQHFTECFYSKTAQFSLLAYLERK